MHQLLLTSPHVRSEVVYSCPQYILVSDRKTCDVYVCLPRTLWLAAHICSALLSVICAWPCIKPQRLWPRSSVIYRSHLLAPYPQGLCGVTASN